MHVQYSPNEFLERVQYVTAYKVAQKSLYALWPAVDKNICIGALLFSMVTDVITPEKYDSAAKIFLACIFFI